MSASAVRRARRLRVAPKAPQHDRGADGPAMLARHRVPYETSLGVMATLTSDGHMLDRMHARAQINDRQYSAAMRLLEMCDAAGLSIAGAAQYGRIGHGGEMSDAMADARGAWNRLMKGLGGHKADLLFSLCHERHPGTAWLATVQAALDDLARKWGMRG